MIDNSDSALQVLGVPRVTDADGNLIRDDNGTIKGSVVFTSLYDDEHGEVDSSDVFVLEPMEGIGVESISVMILIKTVMMSPSGE